MIELLQNGVLTPTADAMMQLASDFIKIIPPNSTITLKGDLGVGKTTFVRGLALALNIQQLITSPTFSIYNIYQGPLFQLIHMDAYRIQSQKEFDDLCLDEFLTPPYYIAIEWPEILDLSSLSSHYAFQLSIHPTTHHHKIQLTHIPQLY